MIGNECMSELNCYYHPARIAKEKCKQCGKLICIECRMVYNEKKVKSGSSTARGLARGLIIYHSVRHEVCPVCYYTQQEKQNTHDMSRSPILIGMVSFLSLALILMFWLYLMLSPNTSLQFHVFYLTIQNCQLSR